MLLYLVQGLHMHLATVFWVGRGYVRTNHCVALMSV